jgi:hypothetical protein
LSLDDSSAVAAQTEAHQKADQAALVILETAVAVAVRTLELELSVL